MDEYVKHIRHQHEDRKGETWCGEQIDVFEFTFENIDHAAYSNLANTRLVPCQNCVKAVVAALQGV